MYLFVDYSQMSYAIKYHAKLFAATVCHLLRHVLSF